MNTTTTTRNGIGSMVAGMVMLLAAVAAPADPPNPATPAAPAGEALPSGQDLLTMEQSLRGPDAASQAGRKQLAGLIERGHLSGVAATRSVSPGEWNVLVTELSKDLTPPSRQTWLAGIRAAYAANPTDLQALGAGDVLAIVSACSQLGDAQVGGLLDQLDPMWSAGKVDWGACLEAAKAWRDRNGEKTQTWALRACKGMVIDKTNSLECSTMVDMAAQCNTLGLQGGYEEFAMMLTTVARGGKLDAGPWEHCPVSARELGALVSTPASRQPLYAELTDARGHARAGLWEVLAWSHHLSATPMEWVAYLNEKIAAAKGDAKTYWLMARAYAQTVNLCEATDPFEGRTFLDQAMAAAQSDEARLFVVRRMAMGYAYCVERAKGQAFLASVAGQFAGETRESFAKLQTDFDEMCTGNEGWLQRKRTIAAAQEAADRKMRLASLLEAARSKGDAKAIGELEQALAKVTAP